MFFRPWDFPGLRIEKTNDVGYPGTVHCRRPMTAAALTNLGAKGEVLDIWGSQAHGNAIRAAKDQGPTFAFMRVCHGKGKASARQVLD